MTNSHQKNLKEELKELIITECERDFAIDDISDDEALIGMSSRLQLDSVDVLQISMAINKKYGIKITDSKKIRAIMSSINDLAQYIEKNR